MKINPKKENLESNEIPLSLVLVAEETLVNQI